MKNTPRTIRTRIATFALAGVVAMSASAGMMASSASAAPASSAPQVAEQLPFGTGYSLCFNQYYRSIKGKEKYNSKMVRFVTDWRDTAQYAKFLNKGNSKENQKKIKGKFYAWAFGGSGAQNCTSNVDFIDWRFERGPGVVRVVGRAARGNILIRITDKDGAIICETRSGTAPADQGGFSFTCEGPFVRPAGTYVLTITGTTRGLRDFVRNVTVTNDAVADIRFDTATPNPTSGPITVGGTTSLPSATVVVTNPDNSVLCQTVSSATAVNSRYAWSCNGNLPGSNGVKVLTATMSNPQGGTTSATLPVVKNAGGGTPGTPGIKVISASAAPNPTTGPVTVSGWTNRPNVKIVVVNPNGSTLCTTTGAATANSNGRYAFSCNGTLTGTPGLRVLTVRATGPNGGRTSTDVEVNLLAPATGGTLTILTATAVPNPTTGPVTITGTTNRPGVKITVMLPNGSTLCTTTGATTKTNGVYAFSCECAKLAGDPGSTVTLTVKAVGPNGGTTRVTLPVTITY